MGLRLIKELDKKSDDMNIYIDTMIYNEGPNAPNFENCNFSATSTSVLLENPHEYVMAIERMTLPLGGIPYFDLTDEQGNYRFSITLEHPGTGVESRVFLQPIASWTDNTPTEGIWEVIQLADVMSQALETAYNNLGVLPAGSPTEPPKLVFEAATEKFVFITQAEYLTTNVQKINIYINYSLFLKFNSFACKYTTNALNGKTGLIFITDNIDNFVLNTSGDVYYKTYQQYRDSAKLSDISNIYITTALVPVDLQTQMVNGRSITDDRSIITDFQVEGSGNNLDTLDGTIIYVPTNHRWLDLQGSDPLYRMDYAVYYRLKDGRSRPLTILKEDHASVKFIFRKRNYVT